MQPTTAFDSPPRRTRTEHQQAVTNHIAETAKEVIREHGRDRFTMAQVAARAGISTETLYSRYQDRYVLLAAVAPVPDSALAAAKMIGELMNRLPDTTLIGDLSNIRRALLDGAADEARASAESAPPRKKRTTRRSTPTSLLDEYTQF